MIVSDKQQILLKLREDTGMNRREFAEYFRIPLRTVQEWEMGNRQMPDYLLRLMLYYVANEQIKNPDVFEKHDRHKAVTLIVDGVEITAEREKKTLSAIQKERIQTYVNLMEQLGADRLKKEKE